MVMSSTPKLPGQVAPTSTMTATNTGEQDKTVRQPGDGPSIPTPEIEATSYDDSVESRVGGLMQQNSPLMKQAATRGKQAAQKRGLLNSSLGVQASQAAVLDRAMAIAGQDAQTAAQKNLSNQDARQQQQLIGTEYGLRSGLSAQEAEQTRANIEAEYGQRRQLSEQEFEQQQKLQEFDIASKEKIAGWNIDSHDRERASIMAAAFEQTYAEQFRTIAQNNQLPADVRERYLQHVTAVRDSNLNLVEQMYGIDLEWFTPDPQDPTAPPPGEGDTGTDPTDPGAGENTETAYEREQREAAERAAQQAAERARQAAEEARRRQQAERGPEGGNPGGR